MASFRGHIRFLPTLVVTFALVGMSSCGRNGDVTKEAQVKKAFDSCKAGLISNQADQVMTCVPKNVDDYLNRLKAELKNPPAAAQKAPDDSPGVDQLLRTALEKKVPDNLRSSLTLSLLLQRIAEKRLLSPRDVAQIDLGHIHVNGDRASGEIYYQGTLTALPLNFIRENDSWKIDILAVLPYAEVLMRLDRALKGETQGEQVEQLVSKLPSL